MYVHFLTTGGPCSYVDEQGGESRRPIRSPRWIAEEMKLS